jgi:hypothetical protein
MLGRFESIYPGCCSTLILKEKFVAGELGFEPRLTESESAVLPLNYSPIWSRHQSLSGRFAYAVVAEHPRLLSAAASAARAKSSSPSRPAFQVCAEGRPRHRRAARSSPVCSHPAHPAISSRLCKIGNYVLDNGAGKA